MKLKIVAILVCMLMLSTVAGSLPSTDITIKQTEKEIKPSNMAYSHDILGEFFTLTTCVPCKYSHRALKALWEGEYHPMHYITMVYDKDIANKWALQRKNELGVSASPTVMWDGPFKKDQGSTETIEGDMAKYNTSIIACGNRNVDDIDINLDVEWLGAVRNDPADGETLVPIEQILTWTSSQMEIDVEVINNEASEFSSRIRVYVNEVNSTFWDDKWGDPYTNCFLDYAWNVFVDIPASSSWDNTTIWDGYDHHTGYKEYYQNITQDNIIIVATVFKNDTNKYAFETTSVRTGYDTDPKRYDIYFGNTTPPPLKLENISSKKYNPPGVVLEWDETYYWKVNERDQKDNVIYGDILSFKTRGNDPPDDPGWENPINNSVNKPIEVNLSWICVDPNGDELTYDVWFGDTESGLSQVAWNQTKSYKVIKNLDFLKTYYWYIVAWEVEYDLHTKGPLWNFRTEQNYPPNPAVDPKPPNHDPAVPTEGVVLEWNGSDPNFGDTLKYDLYFDDVNPPLSKKLSKSLNDWWEIPVGHLTKYQTYYWRVDTYDKKGLFQEGNVWDFTCGDNNPPTPPIIEGPTSGGVNKEIVFSFTSTDPDNHSIKYKVNWGDGKVDTTEEYVPNGTTVNLSHTWTKEKTYTIHAIAIDVYDKESEESTHTITIPRNKVFNLKLLELLFARFPKAFPILRQLLGL